jgi:multidrug resistance efflux pump
MKAPIPLNEFQAAIARHEKAQADLDSANKKVRKAKSNLEKATAEAEAAESEFKLAAANLEQTVKRHVNSALKKGGPDVSLAIAALLAKTVVSDEPEQTQMNLDGSVPADTSSDPQMTEPDAAHQTEDRTENLITEQQPTPPAPSYSISNPV